MIDVAGGLKLLEDRVQVLARWDAPAHRDGEVAVGAAALAEGDVDVEVGHGGIIVHHTVMNPGAPPRGLLPKLAGDAIGVPLKLPCKVGPRGSNVTPRE